jgi:hypothetical protein
MIRVFDNHVRSGFKYQLTGDESWMSSNQFPTKLWGLDRECTTQKFPPINYQQKTIITVFLLLMECSFEQAAPRIDYSPIAIKKYSPEIELNIYHAVHSVM